MIKESSIHRLEMSTKSKGREILLNHLPTLLLSLSCGPVPCVHGELERAPRRPCQLLLPCCSGAEELLNTNKFHRIKSIAY